MRVLRAVSRRRRPQALPAAAKLLDPLLELAQLVPALALLDD
ncbi:MAG: hypothetical protein M5U13_15780 [Thermoanaerobaculia bacterium]|nr:hypothetical protein [Thermoanaerobaculia bacterium]